jgi:AraC family transcriptional regulator
MTARTPHPGASPASPDGSLRPFASRRIEGLLVSEYLVHGPASLASHSHGRASLSLLLHGGYRVGTCNESLDVRAPMVAFFPAGVVRRVDFPAGASLFLWIHLTDEIAARVGAVRAGACGFVPVSSGRPEWLAHRILAEVRASDAASRLLIQGKVLELLGQLSRDAAGATRRHPEWLAEALRAIHDDSGIRLGRLAALCRLHPSHLARAFKQHLGCSVGEYVRQSRVSRARCLLTASSLSLAEIAAECGFADQPHFSREFKRLVGVTPRRFRREAPQR